MLNHLRWLRCSCSTARCINGYSKFRNGVHIFERSTRIGLQRRDYAAETAGQPSTRPPAGPVQSQQCMRDACERVKWSTHSSGA